LWESAKQKFPAFPNGFSFLELEVLRCPKDVEQSLGNIEPFPNLIFF
jgi:hypothetical protein